MSHISNLSAGAALNKLKTGNKKYMDSDVCEGDFSRALRLKTSQHGQKPYAIIVTCSDSRVIPESIFSAGIGDLFVIRVAGNVIDDHQLGSIEYAADHLGCRLVVVLGHTNCGAVNAALSGDPDGFIAYITDEIKLAIGNEKDPFEAGCLNVKRSVSLIVQNLGSTCEDKEGLEVIGAMYHLDSGQVEFFQETFI